MQIRVTKNDGTVEPYLHTKVLGTFNYALALVDDDSLFAAEQLAEAVTFYIYGAEGKQMLTSEEIHLMILSVLTGTGYGHAAQALSRHRLTRRLQRRRIEVISETAGGDACAEPWDKSRIVTDLIDEREIEPSLARTIAGAVEEKVLAMKLGRIRKGLIRQLVMTDTETLLEAHCRLTAAAS